MLSNLFFSFLTLYLQLCPYHSISTTLSLMLYSATLYLLLGIYHSIFTTLSLPLYLFFSIFDSLSFPLSLIVYLSHSIFTTLSLPLYLYHFIFDNLYLSIFTTLSFIVYLSHSIFTTLSLPPYLYHSIFTTLSLPLYIWYSIFTTLYLTLYLYHFIFDTLSLPPYIWCSSSTSILYNHVPTTRPLPPSLYQIICHFVFNFDLYYFCFSFIGICISNPSLYEIILVLISLDRYVSVLFGSFLFSSLSFHFFIFLPSQTVAEMNHDLVGKKKILRNNNFQLGAAKVLS